jgi:hypothetical protein
LEIKLASLNATKMSLELAHPGDDISYEKYNSDMNAYNLAVERVNAEVDRFNAECTV